MNLPIPEFRESCLPDDANARNAFLDFQKMVKRFEPAVKTDLQFSKDRPLEFPPLLVSWLFGTLQRVRVTCWGVISSVNTGNELLFVLAVRALVESTAYLAYINKKLRETYHGNLTRREMTYLALRMKFSTRMPAEMELDEREAQLTSSVNVLTALGYLDNVMKDEFGFRTTKPATVWYGKLSEVCHPNGLGISIGSELDFSAGKESFDVEPGIREGILGQFGLYLRFTTMCFSMLYNRCWERMIQNNEMFPRWTPDTDPQIPFD